MLYMLGKTKAPLLGDAFVQVFSQNRQDWLSNVVKVCVEKKSDGFAIVVSSRCGWRLRGDWWDLDLQGAA